VAVAANARILQTYVLVTGDVRTTEQLVDAGRYAYAHSCIFSETFPARHTARPREIVLVEFDRDLMAGEAIELAGAAGLAQPRYEDALYFGIQFPDVQRDHSVVFLHDPWYGYFGRRDVLMLWCNAGGRELGLEGFDDLLSKSCWFAFVRERSTTPEG